VSYEVELRRATQKELDVLSGQDYKAIAKIISSLEQDPRPPKVKKLAQSGLWRIRVRQFRIVYALDDEAKLVTIVRIIRRREDTYKSL
jgi:mRNA interferase RelE/StbE